MPTTPFDGFAPEYENAIRPSGKRLAWKVCFGPMPEVSHSGTPAQLTTKRLESANTRTPPAVCDGSRSSNKGEMRGGPEVVRPRPRAVLALSPAVNVRLPSEFT